MLAVIIIDIITNTLRISKFYQVNHASLSNSNLVGNLNLLLSTAMLC